MFPNQVAGGVATLISFQIPHACNATVTTKSVEIQFPSLLVGVVPVKKAGWTYLKWNSSRDDGTWGFSLRYDALPGNEIPNEAYDRIETRLTFPTTPGVRVAIPIIQYCDYDLISAWNLTTEPKPAPKITILDVNDVQYIPTQANLRATNAFVSTINSSLVSTTSVVSTLQSQVTSIQQRNLTDLYQRYQQLSQDIQSIKTNNGNGNNPIYYQTFGGLSSSTTADSWLRSDTLAVISIIIALLCMLACALMYHHITQVQQKLSYFTGIYQYQQQQPQQHHTPSTTKQACDTEIQLAQRQSSIQFHS